MAKDQQLIPVFIPPLAALLARAEEVKGSALTETEVIRIRDKASCIMMERGDAAKMTESRGYRDVNPENCWADWHRLRTQMTGKGYLPKIILCLPGGEGFRAHSETILRKESVEYEWREHEERMKDAFEASEFRVYRTLTDEDFDLIGQHTCVLYILSPNFTSGDARKMSQRFLTLGCRLLEAGGIAMKCESSGIAHSRERWIELAKEADSSSDSATCWAALFDAFVQFPIASDTDHYSSGMHLLDQPDMIVERDRLEPIKVAELFRTFALYLLAECPAGSFASGHTFSTSADAIRHRIVWEPCTGYDEDEFFFNPFGRWRFNPVETP